MTFGNRLKQARENKGYNQKQFAERLGVTPARLNYWEKDKREPDVAIIKQIAQSLDVSSDWLIGNNPIIRSIAPIFIGAFLFAFSKRKPA